MFEQGVVPVEEQLVVVGRPTRVMSRQRVSWKEALPKSLVLLVEGRGEFRAQLAQVQIPYTRKEISFFFFLQKTNI